MHLFYKPFPQPVHCQYRLTNHSQCLHPLRRPAIPTTAVPIATQQKARSGTFMCHTCAKQYQHCPELYKHIQQQHNGGNTSSHGNTIACKEDGCTYTCRYLAQLRTHLSKKHLFRFAPTTKEFKSIAGKQLNNGHIKKYTSVHTHSIKIILTNFPILHYRVRRLEAQSGATNR